MTEWIVSSTVLIAAVLAVRRLSKPYLNCRVRYALWLLVLVRLLTPPVALFESPISIENLTGRTELVRNMEAIRGMDELEHAPDGSVWGHRSGEPMTDRPVAVMDYATPERFARLTHTMEAREILTRLWYAGAIVLAAALTASNLRFARRLRRCRVYFDEGVYLVEGLASPCLVGVLRPTVYLTPEAARDERTLRHVLAHEETHRRHGDCLWSLLRLAALCLHWYNPLVWLAVVVSKRDGELACDEAALERLGGAERVAYGETLLSMVTAKPRGRDLLSLSTSMTAGKRPMRERIETIARRPRTRAAALVLALAALLSATALAFTKGTEPPAPPVTEPPEAEAPRQTDVWYADLDGDGTLDRVVLDTQSLIDTGLAGAWIELADGTRIALPDLAVAHVGWGTVALTERDGRSCLLFYSPAMFQGEALYGYTLAAVQDGQLSYLYDTREEVGFSVNPDRSPENDRAAMAAFRDRANAVWGRSRLLFTSDQEVLARLYDADTGERVVTNGAYYIAEAGRTVRYVETMQGLLDSPEPAEEEPDPVAAPTPPPVNPAPAAQKPAPQSPPSAPAEEPLPAETEPGESMVVVIDLNDYEGGEEP